MNERSELHFLTRPQTTLSSRLPRRAVGPERSAVEGSAVRLYPKQICHPDRSEAKWRDLLFPRPAAAANQSATLPLVIPTEALAQRRDLLCAFPPNKGPTSELAKSFR